MKRNRLFLLLAFLGLGLSPAAGDDQPPKDEKKYAPMPWHLVDTGGTSARTRRSRAWPWT